MGLLDWLNETKQRVSTDGTVGIKESAYQLWIGLLRRTSTLYPEGENIYEKEWDLLIVLDACRTDAINQFSEQYPFLNYPNTIHSVGSATYEWLPNTFIPAYSDEISETAYVTANPHIDRFPEIPDFDRVVKVWEKQTDPETGTVPPRAVTDHAINLHRNDNPNRMIVHYMQPHLPSIPDPIENTNAELGEPTDNGWDLLRRGEVTEERVWESYTQNLEYVLDEVEVVLNNVDAETAVITSDHGEAKGELGVYGHPNVPIEPLRRVPWYRTGASDTKEHKPEIDGGESVDISIEERLQSLGYK